MCVEKRIYLAKKKNINKIIIFQTDSYIWIVLFQLFGIIHDRLKSSSQRGEVVVVLLSSKTIKLYFFLEFFLLFFLTFGISYSFFFLKKIFHNIDEYYSTFILLLCFNLPVSIYIIYREQTPIILPK